MGTKTAKGAQASIAIKADEARLEESSAARKDDARKEDAPESAPLNEAGDISGAHIADYAGFNPAVHAVNPDGTPRRKLDGTYARKRGRKPGTHTAQVTVPDKRAQCEIAAAQTCNLLINSCVILLGDEWKPSSAAESEGLKNAFSDYYELRGIPALPPEVMLLIAIGSYAAPRLTQENTVNKIKRGFVRIKSFITGTPK